MDKIQRQVNQLCDTLRKQVIAKLLLEDNLKFHAPAPAPEILEFDAMQIFKLNCPTRQLRKLFRDVHDMQDAKGQFQRPACVAELEWCLKFRKIGYPSSLRIKHGWLPAKEDEDLRKLPAFIALANIYKSTNNILPPINEKAVIKEANEIINALTTKKVQDVF